LRVIVALRPPALYQLADVHLVPAVLLSSLGISVATGVLFGSAPALFAAARNAGDVLRRETTGGSPGMVSRRVRSALTVLQIALSIVLLTGSGLLVRSFTALQRIPLGFEPRGLVYADVILGGPRSRDRVPLLRAPVVERLRSLPGVTGVAVGTMPGKGFISFGGLEAETGTDGRATHVPLLGTIFITPDYFRVARIALVQGRLPDSASTAAWWQAHPFAMMSPEVLVNREFARRLWPGGSAIGRRLRMPAGAMPPGRSATPPSTVVGVVDDTRMPDVRGDVAALQVYSLLLPRLGNVPYLVRTSAPGDVAARQVKQAIASTDPRIYVRRVLSGDTYLREGLAPTRFAMTLLTTFALIALVLAAVGLYGVIAYGVARRTREIGVRMALGAEPRSVMALVMGGGLRLAVLGVAVGVAAAAAATRVLESMLYAVSPADPITFAGIALLVAAIALVASYVPARRALRIDPAETLRTE
jgi:predicted permease